MVNVTHDRDDRRTTLKVFVLVLDLVDDVFHIRVRDALNLVTELFDDEFRRICVNRLVLRCHDAVLHQSFHNVRHTFGHAVGKLTNHDGFWQLHGTNNLFAFDIPTHCLLTGALLLTLHRSK